MGTSAKTYVDQMGRKVSIPTSPKRIISLVPSQTEFLMDIGASVIGRTKFCVHPKDKVKEIPIVGGTKSFRFDTISVLKPDLIIGNKEENHEEGIKVLEKDFPTWISDIHTLNDAFDMMQSLGEVCDLEKESNRIIQTCRTALEQVEDSKKGKVIYLIWKNPWMAAGKNTFIDYMIGFLGYENVITHKRYPELDEQEIIDLDPDCILFSSEPFPFKESHIREARGQWPAAKCQLVDGELFSWYGSRLRNWFPTLT